MVWMHDQCPADHRRGRAPRATGRVCWSTSPQQRRTRRSSSEDLDASSGDEAERLRAEDEMKTTFLQAVSHDLRTPLAAILGLAVTMEREDLDARAGRDARPRASDRRRTRASSTGWWRLPRPRAPRRGVAEPELRPVDVGALIRELVGGVRAGRGAAAGPRGRARHGARPTPAWSSASSRTCSATPRSTRRASARIWVTADAQRRRRR